MGGKGGGDSTPGWYPVWQAAQAKQQQDAALAANQAAADKAASDKAAADQAAANKAAADQAASDKAASDKAASDQAAADAAAAADKAAHTPLGPAVSSGGAITNQPTAAGNPAPGNTGGTAPPSSGDVLGGAVMTPPNYWVGGLGQATSTGRTRGNITTSQ
jgi:membrane protein involved in colicin uptake